MSKRAMREETERLVKEALERKTVTVKQGQTRIATKCGKCGAPIEWQMTIQGNWTPQNLDGTPHWATCPHAAEFRRRRKRSSKEQGNLFGAAE